MTPTTKVFHRKNQMMMMMTMKVWVSKGRVKRKENKKRVGKNHVCLLAGAFFLRWGWWVFHEIFPLRKFAVSRLWRAPSDSIFRVSWIFTRGKKSCEENFTSTKLQHQQILTVIFSDTQKNKEKVQIHWPCMNTIDWISNILSRCNSNWECDE